MPLGDPKIEGRTIAPTEKIIEQPQKPEERKTPEGISAETKKLLAQSTTEADMARMGIEAVTADHADDVEGTAAAIAPEMAELDATITELNQQNAERKTIEAELDQLVAELNGEATQETSKQALSTEQAAEKNAPEGEPSVILDESIKTYENPNDDPAIRATEDAMALEANKMIEDAQTGKWGKGIQREATADEPWASAMRNQRAAEVHVWLDFVSQYPEKALAYQDKIPGIKQALETQARNKEEDRKRTDAYEARIAAASKPEHAANEQGVPFHNTSTIEHSGAIGAEKTQTNQPEKLRDLELTEREFAEAVSRPERERHTNRRERVRASELAQRFQGHLRRYDTMITLHQETLQTEKNTLAELLKQQTEKPSDSTLAQRIAEEQAAVDKGEKLLQDMEGGREECKKELADAQYAEQNAIKRETGLNERPLPRSREDADQESKNHLESAEEDAIGDMEDIASQKESGKRSPEERLESVEGSMEREEEHLASLEESLENEQEYLKEVQERREKERREFEFLKQLYQDIVTIKQRSESPELTPEERASLIERCHTQNQETPEALRLDSDEPLEPDVFIDQLMEKPVDMLEKRLEGVEKFLEEDKDGEYIKNSEKRITEYEKMIKESEGRVEWYKDYQAELQEQLSEKSQKHAA